tara:strand:+ start:343 stop:1173 length:831 start_codon:yes stop_codon:yes gene_type:complete
MSTLKKSEIAQVNDELLKETTGFLVQTNNINSHAVEKVKRFLPELEEKTRAFDRQNSQTTLAMMTLTMLNGQSPYRMMRQIMAEVEKRKGALAEAQVNHAKTLKEIGELESSQDFVEQAEYRQKCVNITTMEQKINGSFKDIACLIDAYNNIKESNAIEDWDEEAFEKEEKKHHVRRAFELMYRNIFQSGRASEAAIEYCQQFGIHPQVCMSEVSGYLQYTAERIQNQDYPHANDLEEFLDEMAEKYQLNPDKTSERLFGKADFATNDYMYKTATK